MTTKNITKEQIRNAAVLELTFRLSCLHAETMSRPADAGIPMSDIQDAVNIEHELKKRLAQLVILSYKKEG